MADIKLFVCCHKPTEVPKHPLLVPIQVGAALADSHFPGFLHDDTGDNISGKNRSYCELTAQYWAWKNIDADYYGFFHYRRYLYPEINARWPYRVERTPTLELLDKRGYERFADLIQQYDLILPKGENMYLPVREHYAKAPYHHQEDLDDMEQIIQDKHPEMTGARETYLSGTVCYFGNIFIMRQNVFQDYCNWLFPLLEEFDRQVDISEYSPQEQRVVGYLAERMFGIFITFQLNLRKLHVLRLPRVHFVSKSSMYYRQRLISILLPPGSRRRFFAKKIVT